MYLARLIFVLFVIVYAATAFTAKDNSYFPVKSIVGVEQIRSDLLQIEAEVEYPNGCYKPESFFGEVDTSKSTIYLSHIVSKQNNICIQKTIPIRPIFIIEAPLKGTYRIVDRANNQLIAEVEVNGF